MKKVVSLALSILFLFLLVACGGTASSGPTTSGAQTDTPAAGGGDLGVSEIKLGLICPISGQSAIAGEYITAGISLVEDELNSAGGLEVNGKKYPVKFIIEDNEGLPEKTVNAIQKLINQDKVVGIIGPDMSKCLLAGGPIAQEAGVPIIGTFTTNKACTEIGDYVFRACFIDDFQGQVAAQYSFNDLGAKTASILYDNSDDYAKGLMENFTKKFEELGGKVIEVQAYGGNEVKDYNVQLSKIKAADADVFFLPNLFTGLPLQVKQARELGITGKIVGGDSFDAPDIPNIAGNEFTNGIDYVAAFSAQDSRDSVQAFVKAYTAKFEVIPNSNALLAYEAAKIMLNGIQTSGSVEGAVLRDAIYATDGYELPSGPLFFDENRNPIKGAVIQRYEEGVPTFVTAINPS